MSFSEYLLYMVEPVEMLRKERSVNVEYEKHKKKDNLKVDFFFSRIWFYWGQNVIDAFHFFFFFIVWS